MPYTSRVHWDWRAQVGWVRFKEGVTPDLGEVERALLKAINEDSEFSASVVTFHENVKELHRELR